jgi:beta-aspartyl-peptidase (threonine type)
LAETANPRVTFSWGAVAAGYCVLVHGGAGSRAAHELPREREGCARAAEAAAQLLHAGASALDAVQRAVEVLEDDPLFNAGTGGALTEDGTLELDASIMNGSDLRAGAVCCLPPYRHPIAIARAVLEENRHVLYAAAGADALARRAGFVPAAPETMVTEHARRLLERFRANQEKAGGGNTVGAVARDRHGNLAAATSTGGVVGQRPGRVGDSPILGAGTYADNAAGAASATGRGENILRLALCSRATAAVAGGASPEDAARAALEQLAARLGAEAGLIVVSPSGALGVARSTSSMPFAAAWDGMLHSGD